jgi:hypothetical protein
MNAQGLMAALVYIATIGLIWSGLSDTVYTTLPTNFPTAVVASPGTWAILTGIWGGGTVIILLTIGLNLIGGGNIARNIVATGIVFIVWFCILISWISMYQMVNYTLPAAASAAFNQPDTSGNYLSDYNNGAVILMIGFGLYGMVASVPVRQRSTRYGRPRIIRQEVKPQYVTQNITQKQKVIRQKEIVFRNEPKFIEKEVSTIRRYGPEKEGGKGREYKFVKRIKRQE